jgi:tetratricopeptide (TPR) repeat protein
MRRLATLLLFSLLPLASCQEEPAATPSGAASEETIVASQLGTLRAEGEVEGVVALLEPLFEAGTISKTDALTLAEARVIQNELPSAIRVLKASLDGSPAGARNAIRLAQLYASIGQKKMALDVLLAAREAGAGGADLVLELGLAQGRMGDLAEARRLLGEARELGGNGADIDYNLSLILLEQGQPAEARALLERLLESDPSRLSVRRELARAILTMDHEAGDSVSELCNAVLDEDPEDWRAWELLGDVELHRQDYMASQAYYHSALKFGSQELGGNPPRVEEKYVLAAQGARDLLIQSGAIPDPALSPRSDPPPLPVGFQERQREARRQALEAAEKEQAVEPQGGAPADGGDGR